MQNKDTLSMEQVIYLHFKVPGHILRLEDFIATASSTAGVLYSLQKHGDYSIDELEVYLEPPLPGSFLGTLRVVGKLTKSALAGTATAAVAIGGVATFLDTGMGKAMLDESTSLSPEEIGREIVRKTGLSRKEKSHVASEKQSIEEICEKTISFLEKPGNSDFFGQYPTEKYREAYTARNKFYSTCESNPLIEAVGFDDSETFPINRADFGTQIISLPFEDEVKLRSKKTVEIETIQVYSPDWSRSRKWVGMTKSKEVYLRIDDENFWSMAMANELPLSLIPIMKVQWVRPLHTGRQSNVVVKVLEFNGKEVSPPLERAAIDALENDEFATIDLPDNELEFGTQMSFFEE